MALMHRDGLTQHGLLCLFSNPGLLVSFALSSVFHTCSIICNFTYIFTCCTSINFLNLHARLCILYCSVQLIFTLKAVQLPWPLSVVKSGFIWICLGVFQIFFFEDLAPYMLYLYDFLKYFQISFSAVF